MRFLVVLLMACGGKAAVPDDTIQHPTGPHEPSCFEIGEHVDALLGPRFKRGEVMPVFATDQPMSRDDFGTDCPLWSVWVRVCLMLSPTAGELRECAPEAEPTLLSYAGPTPYQKHRFEECVLAATDRPTLATCGYYKPGSNREPLYPDEPPP
jgi:hypothetical protein